jgi:hypothetical protein
MGQALDEEIESFLRWMATIGCFLVAAGAAVFVSKRIHPGQDD